MATVQSTSTTLGKRQRNDAKWHCELCTEDGFQREVIVIEDTPPLPSSRVQETPCKATTTTTTTTTISTHTSCHYDRRPTIPSNIVDSRVDLTWLAQRTPPQPTAAAAVSSSSSDISYHQLPPTPQEPWMRAIGVQTRSARARQQQQQQQQQQSQHQEECQAQRGVAQARHRLPPEPRQPQRALLTSGQPIATITRDVTRSDKITDDHLRLAKRRRQDPPTPFNTLSSLNSTASDTCGPLYTPTSLSVAPLSATGLGASLRDPRTLSLSCSATDLDNSTYFSPSALTYGMSYSGTDKKCLSLSSSSSSSILPSSSNAPVCQCDCCTLPVTPLRSDSLHTLSTTTATAATATATATAPTTTTTTTTTNAIIIPTVITPNRPSFVPSSLSQSSQISLPFQTATYAPPVVTTTVTATLINSVASTTDTASSTTIPATPCDDKDGHYILTPNENLTPRYKIMRLLGQGTFGKVAQCWDRKTRRYCAIKIIRSVQKYRDASRIEIRVLRELQRWDPNNRFRCIHLKECFEYRNHTCMVFDMLGQSVFDFMKSNHFAPFPANHIQLISRQLIRSVAFLHRIKLVHTDLKPENILLINDTAYTRTTRNGKQYKTLTDTEIRLIDFGSATFEKEYHSAVVSTRHYRAPEIIIGSGWSFPCDMWSIGCILVELFTGEALFQTHDNLEHLAMMEAVIGPIPNEVSQQANHSGRKFFRSGRLAYPTSETSRSSRKYVAAMHKLNDIIPPTNPFNACLLDLVRQMLVYNPASRITAEAALEHTFFRLCLSDDSESESPIAPDYLHFNDMYNVVPPVTHSATFASKAPVRNQAFV